MVILVCSGALLGAFNIHQPFVEFAGAGASVPSRFRKRTLEGVKEAVDENGFLGFLWEDLRQVPSGSVQL